MKKLAISKIVHFSATLQDWSRRASQLSSLPTSTERNHISAFLETIEGECRDLDMPVSLRTIRDAKQWIAKPSTTHPNISVLLGEVLRTIQREMELLQAFSLKREKAPFFDNPNGFFGEEMFAHFPSVLFDAEEAVKCWALSRNTACVFHTQRILEIGLRSLGKTLNLTNSNPTWEAILDKGDKELKKPEKDRAEEWSTDHVFFSSVIANLRAVKTAWRNPTMRPQAKYTDEEAEDILRATRTFMRHLAKKLSEEPC